MNPQSMGTTVAALEERGMVARRAHPTDGRPVNIGLTTRGAAVRRNANGAKRTWLAQAVAQLDEPGRAALVATARIIRRLAEE
jgi:DNA-binding MarR family transcriptional regulator